MDNLKMTRFSQKAIKYHQDSSNNIALYDAISFTGRPGAGKGYIIEALLEKIIKDYGLNNEQEIILKTGEIVRKHQKDIPEFLEALGKGELAPTKLLLPYVENEIAERKQKSGGSPIIFDGFPRNLEQLEAMDKSRIKILYVNISADDETCYRRMNQRARDAYDTDRENQSKRILTFKSETKPMIDKLSRENRLHVVDNNDGKDSVGQIIRIYNEALRNNRL